MPIPPLYMIEIKDNVYELIDGLQRISTWLHFRGRHPDRKGDNGELSKLTLQDCDIVASLNGLTYDNLPNAVQIKLKRNFIRVEVIRKESDARLRYHMFKRLNTGGAPLSAQEVRNCTIRLLDPEFNDFLADRSRYAAFAECTKYIRADRQREMYREELVLRFFALKNDRERYDHLVEEFLTRYMEEVSDPEDTTDFDYVTEANVFERTFDVCKKIGGDQIFAGPNTKFTINIFEAWTIGLQEHLDGIDTSDTDQIGRLSTALSDLVKENKFREVAVGGGLNYPAPLRQRIALAGEVIAGSL